MADLATPAGRTIIKLAGNPDGLADSATTLKDMGETVTQVCRTLTRIDKGEGSRSDRVDMLKEHAGKCAKEMGKVQEIYSKTGIAIAEYQIHLDDDVSKTKTIHQTAVDLLPKVNAAEENLRTAQTQQSSLQNTEPDPNADQQKVAKEHQDAADAVTDASGALTRLREQLDELKTQFDDAARDLDDAAKVAKSKIREAIDNSPAKDSFWDNISSILKVLKTILEIAAIVVAIVGIFCTGGLILMIGAAIAGATLLVDAMLMKSGRASWGDIAMDIVGVVPFGKVLKGAKAGYKAANGASRAGKIWGGAKGGLKTTVKSLNEGLNPVSAARAGERNLAEATTKRGEAFASRMRNARNQPYTNTHYVDAARQNTREAEQAWGNMNKRQKFLATMRSDDMNVAQARRITEVQYLDTINCQQRRIIGGALEGSSNGNLLINSMDLSGKVYNFGDKAYDLYQDGPSAAQEYVGTKHM